MSKTYLKSINEDLHSISIEDVNYKVINGVIEVANEHVHRLIPHGFIVIEDLQQVTKENIAIVKKTRVKK